MGKLNTSALANIKLVITDIDGVWTDGGLYYTSDGLKMKRFQVKDGMGVVILREHGIETAIVSGDVSDIGMVRGQRLKIELLYNDAQNKRQVLDEICTLRNLKLDEIAFIGDDINDLEVIRCVGLTAAPADAVKEVLDSVDYICSKSGGEGAFREFVELIVKSR